jgi:signal transduction histidine kinase
MIVGASFGIGLMISRARARGRLLRLEAQTARLHERERIAQDLHDDLGANLTEISLIAGLAAEDAAGAAQQERIPIIAVKARELVSTLDEIVWAVNPRHDTLASFVEYLTASAAELLEAGGIGLRQALPASLPDLALDAEQRHALYLAAREALNNAVKHSAATEARLGVEFTEAMLKVTVQDNGRGFRTESKNLSEGLRNMQARLAGIGGSCDISSEPSGTCVRFVLPLKPTASS